MNTHICNVLGIFSKTIVMEQPSIKGRDFCFEHRLFLVTWFIAQCCFNLTIEQSEPISISTDEIFYHCVIKFVCPICQFYSKTNISWCHFLTTSVHFLKLPWCTSVRLTSTSAACSWGPSAALPEASLRTGPVCCSSGGALSRGSGWTSVQKPVKHSSRL